jgi:hypothetical protein
VNPQLAEYVRRYGLGPDAVSDLQSLLESAGSSVSPTVQLDDPAQETLASDDRTAAASEHRTCA